MKLAAALSVPVLALAAGVLVAPPASAHTPAISASCDGVRIGATAYDAGLANRWSVTVAGVTTTGTFGASFSETVPVPQDGATSTWSAFVEAADGGYRTEQSGEVGPCGTPPVVDVCPDLPSAQPEGTACAAPPSVERVDAGLLQGCDVAFDGHEYGAGVLRYEERYDDTHAFDEASNAWVLVPDDTATVTGVDFTPWSIARQVAEGCVDQPAQPPAAEASEQSLTVDCAADAVVTTTYSSSTPYVYEAATNSWVLGEPVQHAPVTTEAPTRPGDCDRGVEAAFLTADDESSAVLVPTAVDAGLVDEVATTATASAVAAPEQRHGSPALPLVALGGALVAAAALRVARRS